jgi:hypothetical protein
MKARKPQDDRKESDERHPEKPPRDDVPKDDPFAIGREPDDRRPATPTRSKLVIPYYPKDIGDRSKPFPAGVLSWWCEGLRITQQDGTPYLGKLDRGETYKVEVDVANAGNASAWAEVALYWADPSVGFGPPHLRRKPELGPACTVPVAPGFIDDSATIILAPTATTPDHICLLAVVSAFDDPPSGSWDPLSDRHYAQHNVDVVQVDQGGVAAFWFFATNPLYETATLVLRVRPARLEELRALSTTFGADTRELRSESIGLTLGDRGRLERPDSELELELAAGERRLCQGVVSAEGLRRGELSAVTVEMNAKPVRSDRDAVGRGSFGAIVFVN